MVGIKGEVSLKKKNISSSILVNFKHHENALKKYLSKFFIPSHEIEDICQETFLRSFESNIQNEIQRPKSFMYRVATNLIMSQYRRSSYKLTDYIDDVGEELTPVSTADIENNIDALPIEIITGNSIEMKKIITNIIDEKKLSGNYSSAFNLGSIVITDKR